MLTWSVEGWNFFSILFEWGILAHGVGARTSLPLPFWQLAWGSMAALGFSFAGLGVLWKKPVLAEAAAGSSTDKATSLLKLALPLVRVLSLLLFLLSIAAGLFGEDQALQNITPVTIYVIFWVGIPFLSAFFGDIWRALSPFETIAWLLEKVRPAPATREAPNHVWFSTLAIFGFLFLELAHPSGSSPRVLAWGMIIYSAVTLTGLLLYGRSWLRTGEGFGVLFSLIAAMSPVFRTSSGALGWRLPLSGLMNIEVRPGTVVLILVALGGTSFDGLSESDLFRDVVGTQSGWEAASPAVLGLLVTIGVAWGLYWLGSRFTASVADSSVAEAADAFAVSLIPILWGYVIAHYALLLIDETQRFWYLLSNPFGVVDSAGEPALNLFGAAGGTINFNLVDLSVVAWVQTIAIVVGHIAGVMAAHDIALRKFNRGDAMRSQYAMLVVMMVYSVGGLALLFNG